MKKILIPFLAIGFLATTACKKTSQNCVPVTKVAPDDEIEELRTYLSEKGITAKQDERGFFYVISEAGDEDKPEACSSISVVYKGTLINGVVFDEATTATTMSLNGVITAWRGALPLIGEGGKITIYSPPSLAYGSNPPTRDIPPNAVLIFDIELKKIVKLR